MNCRKKDVENLMTKNTASQPSQVRIESILKTEFRQIVSRLFPTWNGWFTLSTCVSLALTFLSVFYTLISNCHCSNNDEIITTTLKYTCAVPGWYCTSTALITLIIILFINTPRKQESFRYSGTAY